MSEYFAVIAREDDRVTAWRTFQGAPPWKPLRRGAARDFLLEQSNARPAGRARRMRSAHARPYASLPVLSGRGGPKLVPVWSGSPLDDLLALGRALIGRFPWTLEEAIWFVLTDDVPYVSPICLTGADAMRSEWAGSLIGMAMAPWVSDESLLKHVRQLRKALLNGKANRPYEPSTLAVLPFAEERRRGRKTWDAIRVEWNAQNPETASFPDASSLRRAYLRGRSSVRPPAVQVARIEQWMDHVSGLPLALRPPPPP